MSQEDLRYRPHPWHGLDAGPEPPERVQVFVEITPFDLVKYEVDKRSGYLRVDRPQRTSSLPPALYGFIPRTLAGARVAACMEGAQSGDMDPLDICVISERPIERAEIVVTARVVGGIPMLDGSEADDKIIAVLDGDPAWSDVRELAELPQAMVGRLRHYFATYKALPGEETTGRVGIAYPRERAERVIRAALADYADAFGP
ncbi:MAG: inorganic pyrophosphatase [Gemmatimonadetes bacterium]|nr:inorganic pyrophosphatase [Gemmatimonadota bacterium]